MPNYKNLSRHWVGNACKAASIRKATSNSLSEVACCMRFSHVYKGHGWDCIHFSHLLIEVACCMCSPHVYKGLDRGLHALRGSLEAPKLDQPISLKMPLGRSRQVLVISYWEVDRFQAILGWLVKTWNPTDRRTGTRSSRIIGGMRLGCDWGCVWDKFWFHFGINLGAILGSIWDQF